MVLVGVGGGGEGVRECEGRNLVSENCLRLDFPQSSMLLSTMAYTYGHVTCHVTMLLPCVYNVIFLVSVVGNKLSNDMYCISVLFDALESYLNQILFYLSRSRLLQSLHKSYS